MLALELLRGPLLALVMVALACQQVASFRYIPCRLNDSGAVEKSAHVDSCKEAEGDHCVITRGSNVTFSMAFDVVRPFERATMRVSEVDMGNKYEVFHTTDACQPNSGLKCPASERSQQTFSQSLAFSGQFPAGFRLCRFELIDEDEQPIVCSQFLALIQ